MISTEQKRGLPSSITRKRKEKKKELGKSRKEETKSKINLVLFLGVVFNRWAMFGLMEYMNKDLNSLIERAWALHGRLNCEIEKRVEFCRFCSEHGRYCDVADQTPFEERKRLIIIRDSVKHVENILLSLQKLQSWQLRERNEELTRLEERRLALIELVRNYKGRPLDVVREINACFGDEKANNNDNNNNLQIKKWPVLVCGIKKLLFVKWKWKWQKAVSFAVKFLILTASISSLVHLNHSRRRKVSAFLDSREVEMRDSLLSISRSPLNVFYGKG